mmetsp:Transcript_10431/g.11959  ORF Transcript_10431/g.11959 Transcript_10431/m.11959 type:complete len:279 (+) Transcript_10431:136-972(+)
MSLIAELSSGGVAGACGILVTQPIDTVRVRLQVNSTNGKGIRNVFQTIFYNEGVRGLFKGIGSPLVTTGVMNSLLFFSYEAAAAAIRREQEHSSELSLSQVAFCGVVSGTPCAMLNSVTELVKCKAQVNVNSKGYIYEEWLIFKDLIKNNRFTGKNGPLRGLGLTLLRDVPSYGLYFFVYEYLCRQFKANGHLDNTHTLIAGGCAGSAAWGSIYPIDVVKTRWQTARQGQYKSVLDCARNIWVKEGPGAFSKGFGATMLKAWPQNAVVFFTYELLMSS